MYDALGVFFGLLIILFLISPILLSIYMWTSSKIDIDNDGKEDIPNRWQ